MKRRLSAAFSRFIELPWAAAASPRYGGFRSLEGAGHGSRVGIREDDGRSGPCSILTFHFRRSGVHQRGKPVRGKAAIAADWKKFYDSPRAPFSWKPDLVEVLPSGTLAYSTGPVANPEGMVVARFQLHLAP